MSFHRVTGSAAELIEVTATEGESSPVVGQLSRKQLARPARIISAELFDRVCELSRLSNVVIARWLRVDERRVREMRSGEKPVRIESVVQMPPSIEWGLGVALQEHSKSRALKVLP